MAAGEVAVTIDGHFARIGSKSFAIRQINTVDVQSKLAHSRWAVLWWGLAAALCLLMLASGPDGARAATGQGATVALGLAVLFGLLAFRAWRRAGVRDYILVFNTSSGSAQAVRSRDKAFIFSLRAQVEKAMIGAG